MDVSIFEVIFNAVYLITISLIVLTMNARVNLGYKLAFYSLILGDIIHLGTRVSSILGDATLIGYGNIAASFSFTAFYIFLFIIWENGTSQSKYDSWLVMGIILLIIIRCAILTLPINNWGQYDLMCMIRNAPLVLVQFILGYKMIRDKLKIFNILGWMIVFSALCFSTAIVLLEQYPMIGMLMIPKTILYVCMAYFIRRHYVLGRKI